MSKEIKSWAAIKSINTLIYLYIGVSPGLNLLRSAIKIIRSVAREFRACLEIEAYNPHRWED